MGVSTMTRKFKETFLNRPGSSGGSGSGGTGVDAFEGKGFYNTFMLGDKVTQGAASNLYEGTVKPSKRTERPQRYAVRQVLKFRLKDKHRKDLDREVGILREVDHPNVVKVHQFYKKEKLYYYVVLESLKGGELFDRMVKKESYNEREARDVCIVLVGVIGYLHSKGIVHRDLKPASVLLASPEAADDPDGGNTTTTTSEPKVTTVKTRNEDGTTTTTRTTTVTTTTVVTTTAPTSDGFGSSCCGKLKLTDFGRACSVQGGPVRWDGESNEFMAPEMLLGKTHNKPVDMWSLGCLAYILLSGKHPFFEKDRNKMFLRVAAGDYEFKSDLWANTSEEAKGFIQRLLTVDAGARMTAEEAKGHPWLLATARDLEARDLRTNLQEFKLFNAKQKLRTAFQTVVAAKRMMQIILPPPPASVDISSTYAIDFTSDGKLGEGSFGKVFRATRKDGAAPPPPGTPRLVAVKRIEKEGLDERHRDEVINEARIMRELNHPNVISIYDFYEDDPRHFDMVLELMDGGELFGRIVKKEFYNEAEARDVCVVLLRAVKYIHDQGIVHRDLKPENLLLASTTDDSSIRVADFGFASSIRGGTLRKACGTPVYLAPEMLTNIPYTTSVDMWSVGVIIYVLLAGYPPFHDKDQNKMFRAIKKGTFEFHEQFWGEVSAEAKDLVSKLLTVDPGARMTASDACMHPWLSTERPQLSNNNLSAGLEKLKVFNALRKFRVAIKTVMAARKMAKGFGMEES